MKKILAMAIMLAGLVFPAVAQDTKALYPGGKEAMDAYLTENMQYPVEAKQNGIEGVVTVTFIVKSDGTLSDVRIARMVDPDLESEAIRLVNGMPKWTPATRGGTPAESDAEIEIAFTLD